MRLENWMMVEDFITLSGGSSLEEREVIKRVFQESPHENRTRILIATDAASEGLNFTKSLPLDSL